MDPITLAALEYQGLKSLLERRLRSPLGRQALERLAPSESREEVRVMRERAREALAYLIEFRAPSPGEVEDPAPILAELEPEGALVEPVKLARLAATIRAAIGLRDEIAAVRTRYPRLWDVVGAIPALKPVLNELAGKISPEGKIEDHASSELQRLRKHLASLSARIERLMRAMLERAASRDAIQDAFVTVRNGRYVIPVRVEARREIPGIIHGASSTGATVFMEPMEAVEANNELVTVREEEEAEERRILMTLAARVRSNAAELRAMCRILGEADLVAACARFAKEFDCRPASEGEEIALSLARHPVLQAALEERAERIVPLDIRIPAGEKVLVLSGPNTGGKTVALKTIGLLALMNQSGILLPAADAILPTFARILADVGDRQSITENLSTFSAKMIRIAGMSRDLSIPALVLLDEVGGGTDPEEEGALAVAIVDHFRRKGAGVVATTHHGALKAYAELTPGAVNASMEFDEAALAPTYRFVPGVAGRSGGLDMAARFGLPVEILTEARGRMSEAHRIADQYLARLHALIESREADLAEARQERERARGEREEAREIARQTEIDLRRKYEAAVSEALARIAEAGDDVVRQVRDRAAQLQLRGERRQAAAKVQGALREEVTPPSPSHLRSADLASSGSSPPPADLLAPGDEILVRTLGAKGVLESIDRKRGRAEILVRGMRMTVSLADCVLPAVPGGALPGPPSMPKGVSLDTGGKEHVASEINLIGKRIEEARELLDKFLDDTLLAGHREIRIIHGHGSGRLRAAVGEFLRAHPLVASHHAADDRAGGTGATVAVLKE